MSHCSTCHCVADSQTGSQTSSELWPQNLDTDAPNNLDARIVHLELLLCSLKEQRNTIRAPVYRLPSKLLLRILGCVALDRTREPRDQTWIRFTFVCRRWRTEALACPELWSHLDLSGSFVFTEAMIARSSPAPLSLFNSFSKTHSFSVRSEVLAQVWEEMRRVSNIAVYISAMSLPGFVKRLASISYAPLLETLIVQTERAWEFPELSAQLLPRLRSLILYSCVIHLDPGVFAVFRHLDALELQKVPPSSRFTVSRALEFLSAMPAIKVLRLRDVFPDKPRPSDLVIHLQGPVTLDKLRRLEINAPSTIFTVLAHHLEIPAAARVLLTSESTHTDSLAAQRDALSAMMTRFASQAADYQLDVEIRSVPSADVAIYVSTAGDGDAGVGGQTFSVRTNDLDDDPPETILDIFGPIFAPIRVKSLKVRAERIPIASWTAFFGHLPDVERLEITHCPSIRLLLDALGAESRDQASGAFSVPFPNLRYLTLRRLYVPEEIEPLQRMLEARLPPGSAVACAIRRLSFIDYGGRDRIEVGRLEALVREVEWSGDDKAGPSRSARLGDGD